MYEPLVRTALLEDLGGRDHSRRLACLTQLEQALALGVGRCGPARQHDCRRAQEGVAMAGGQGDHGGIRRITAATAPDIAATGVDLISVGWVTHSAAALDIGLDYLELDLQEARRNRAQG
jgi:nicotinate-nucleotide pyrophosphorylase (carboxylating)